MARLLLVEDDSLLARAVAAILRADGYSVDVAESGAAALDACSDEPFSLIVLDIGLPDMSGFEVLTRLRRGENRTPVLVLTARDGLDDRIAGLDLGADDYVLKPFDPPELCARVRALLRRAHGLASSVISLGNMEINLATATASVAGRTLDLRRREWSVLERLVAHHGKVVSKERLIGEVFSYDEPVAPNAIEVYIARLRRKLEPDGPRIKAMRGIGYLIDAG